MFSVDDAILGCQCRWLFVTEAPPNAGLTWGEIMSIALQVALLSMAGLTAVMFGIGWIHVLSGRWVQKHRHAGPSSTGYAEESLASGVRPAGDVAKTSADEGRSAA